MNNTVLRKVVVTAAYQSLVPQQLIASVDISAPPSNAGPVFFKGDDGADVPFLAGEWHFFEQIDLSALQVKGLPGDVVTLVGNSR